MPDAATSLPDMLEVTLTVNGRPATVEFAPSESLAHVLRERLGLTGTKISCDVQACGACTVLVEGLPRSACTFLAYEARDREVITVEGLAGANGELSPIQRAFLEASAFQCGYCTSGMLVAATAFLAEQDRSDEALIEHMNGNLCRCTGYLSIVAAMVHARDGGE